jgi:hypothetical protein
MKTDKIGIEKVLKWVVTGRRQVIGLSFTTEERRKKKDTEFSIILVN